MAVFYLAAPVLAVSNLASAVLAVSNLATAVIIVSYLATVVIAVLIHLVPLYRIAAPTLRFSFHHSIYL